MPESPIILREPLARFAAYCETLLAAHDGDRGPTGWRNARLRPVFTWLRRYYQNLDALVADAEIGRGDHRAIQHQAGNVANLAMMIWDLAADPAASHPFPVPDPGEWLSRTSEEYTLDQNVIARAFHVALAQDATELEIALVNLKTAVRDLHTWAMREVTTPISEAVKEADPHA